MRRNSIVTSRQSSRISTSSHPDQADKTVQPQDNGTVPNPDEIPTVETKGLDEKIEEGEVDEADSSGWTKQKLFTVITFCIANFSVGAYYSLLGPFFPQEAAQKGMSSTVTGLVFSEFELVIIFTSPLYGAYLTKIGAKHLYISGLVISGGAAILFGLLQYCPPGTVFTVMCIVVRTVEACGTAGFVTASYAILANTFRDRVATMMGYLELCTGLGLMVGPPIGGLLYQVGGFKMPFIVTGMMNLIIGLMSLCLLPNQDSLRQLGGPKMWTLLKMPVILLMVLAVFAGTCCIGFTDVALALQLEKVYNFNAAIIGLIFLVGPGVYALTTPVWGILSDKMPHFSVVFILLGYLLAGTGFIFMGPVPFLPIPNNWLWLLLLTLGLMGLGIGSLVASFQVMISAAIASGMPQNLDTYGVVSGLFTLSFSLGAFTGPLLGGYLIDTVKFEWATFIFGCIVLMCVLIMGIYVVIVCPCTKPPPSKQCDISEDDETSALCTSQQQLHDGRTRYGGMDTNQRA